MASVKARLTARLARLRERRPFVDHAVKTVLHYGEVNGNVQAGAITFFGFLSFFPILALGFFVIGYVSQVYDGADRILVDAINEIFPGLVGNGEDQIALQDFEDNAGAVGLVGLVGVLYSGLGWLSHMREALLVMFKMPEREKPNFVVGKLVDVVLLAAVGLTLLLSVALSSLVTGLSKAILELLGLYDVTGVPTLVMVLGAVLAIATSAVLFLALFKLLAKPQEPDKALLHGAVLAALAFEVLKLLATFLIASTKSQPAFQAFGVALILVIWINYFARVTMFGAAWAYTSPIAEERRGQAFLHMPGAAVAGPPVSTEPATSHRAEPGPTGHKKAIVVGGALAGLTAVGAVAALRKRGAR